MLLPLHLGSDELKELLCPVLEDELEEVFSVESENVVAAAIESTLYT